jgi:hypothetical protein
MSLQMKRKVAGDWIFENPILKESEFGVELSDPIKFKIGDGFTHWNDLPYFGCDGGDGGSETLFEVATLRMYYDIDAGYGIPYPIEIDTNSDSMANSFQTAIVRKYYPWLLTNFDEYTNFLFEISEIDGHYIKDIQFSSWDDFRTYLNNNLSHDINMFTKSCTIRLYSKIKLDYKKPNFKGINSLFNKLNTRGNYYNKMRYVNGAIFDYNLSDEIYKYFFGFHSPTIEYDKTYWLSTKRKNRYNLFRNTKEKTGINSGGDRNYLSLLDQKLYSASDKYWNSVSSVGNTKNRAYLILNDDIISFYGKNELSDKEYISNYLSKESLCIIYKMVDKKNGLNQAFMIRPVGVDNLYVDYIQNYSGATLYGAFFNDFGTHRTMIRKINAEEIHSINLKTSWKLKLSDYEDFTIIEKGDILKNRFLNFKLFYVFSNGTMSALSDTTLYHETHVNGAKLKRIVRNKT